MTATPQPQVVSDRRDPDAVDRILRELPEWFGVESAIREYVDAARTQRSYLALIGDQVVGALLVTEHFPESAEIHLIAVTAEHHRHGIGTRLLAGAEADLVGMGVRFLQVKTLGPSHPSRHYARTRAFYQARGFAPLEELQNLWPGNPCLIMLKSLPTVDITARSD